MAKTAINKKITFFELPQLEFFVQQQTKLML